MNMARYEELKLMFEYIERKTLYEFCKDQIEEETGAYSKGRNAGLRCAMSAAMNKDAIPSADVRPVVLCMDCKHNCGAKTWVDHEITADCTNGHGYPPLDWFCADGVKRDES